MKGYAVSLANVSNCIIENNLIENNIVGIYLYGYSSNNTISKNVLEGNERSIELINSVDNEITENNVTDALVSGISLDAGSGNVVSMNRISDLEDGNGALMLWVSSDNTIHRNILFGGNLFLMINCSNNILTENFVINSHYGVFIGNSSNNTFYRNYFINVTQQVLDNEILHGSPSKNIWDNGIEGNYWSNYNGKDTNNDGIGDSVQLLYENNLDSYPLINYPEIKTKLEKNREPTDSISIKSEFTYTILASVSIIIMTGIIIAMKKRKKITN
jgi:parallel beta-helix repeat protein